MRALTKGCRIQNLCEGFGDLRAHLEETWEGMDIWKTFWTPKSFVKPAIGSSKTQRFFTLRSAFALKRRPALGMGCRKQRNPCKPAVLSRLVSFQCHNFCQDTSRIQGDSSPKFARWPWPWCKFTDLAPSYLRYLLQDVLLVVFTCYTVNKPNESVHPLDLKHQK